MNCYFVTMGNKIPSNKYLYTTSKENILEIKQNVIIVLETDRILS